MREYNLYFINLMNRIEGIKIHIARVQNQLKNLNEKEVKKDLDKELKDCYEILNNLKKEYEDYNEAK